VYGRLHEEIDLFAAIAPAESPDIGIKGGATTAGAQAIERDCCFLYCFGFVYPFRSDPEQPESARHAGPLAIVDEEGIGSW